MKNRLFIAEKPDVGRKIAALLGNPRDMRTHIETDNGTVTWAFGHLLNQAEPGHYQERWKSKALMHLPINPRNIERVPEASKEAQVAVIGKLLASLGKQGDVVISTDAGPEGELIGRELLMYHRYQGRVLRFWSSAATPDAMRAALNDLQPGEKYEGLFQATLGRSDGDWVLGMNLSRAVSAMMQAPCFIGRVGTPTLAMVVRRDAEILNFRPRDYFEVIAVVRTEEGFHQVALRYPPPRKEEERLWTRAEAQEIATAAQGQRGTLTVESKVVRNVPPAPPALDDIQKAANQRMGWSAKRTLDTLQGLYETHTCISYPRTDCNVLDETQWRDVTAILHHLKRPDILPVWPPGDWQPLKRASVYNSSQMGDHPAIGPLPTPAPWEKLNADEKACYRLVAQFFLAYHLPDAESLQTIITMPLAGVTFAASGRVPQIEGWKVVFPVAQANKGARAGDPVAENKLPPVRDGMVASVESASVTARKTEPPLHYTEATLLTDMGGAAKFVRDPALKKRLSSDDVGGLKGEGFSAKKATGIGTQATRAATFEKLKKWDYIEEQGRKILSTSKGQTLIRAIEKWLPEYADPDLTAAWEVEQESIRSGKQSYRGFLDQIIEACTAAVNKLRADAPADVMAVGKPVSDGTLCPATGEPVIDMGDHWMFPGYPSVRASKVILTRPMLLAEFVRVFENKPEPGETLAGFVGKPKEGEKEGKPFSAALKYAPDPTRNKSFAFVYPDSAGNASFITVNGTKCFSTFMRREMSEEDYKQILASGKEGVEFEFVSQKTTRPYRARVVYNSRAKPYPKFELAFDENGDGGQAKIFPMNSAAPRKPVTRRR